jgi:ABC-2 type transport system ATP-binding protein
VEPLQEALRAAQTLPGVEKAWVDDGKLRLLTDPGRAAEINAGLVRADLRVSELRPVERSLEEAFLQLTAEKDAKAPTGTENDGR